MRQRYLKEFLLLYIMSAKAIAHTYARKNVKFGAIDCVAALVFNPAQSNLPDARTDVGGAYRWHTISSNLHTACRLYGAG